MIVTGAVVQARMSSRRLPGKVLRELSGRPLLDYVVERLGHAKGLHSIVVATSDTPADDPVAEFCRRHEISCFRGHLDDVARRVVEAARAFGIELVVRISGDSPLIDPAIVDRVVALYAREQPDLATNVWPRTFPRGQSVEVFSVSLLEGSLGSFDPLQREHVTKFFYDESHRFRVANLVHDPPLAGANMTIDTDADAILVEKLLSRLERPHQEYGLTELYPLLQELAADADTSQPRRA